MEQALGLDLGGIGRGRRPCAARSRRAGPLARGPLSVTRVRDAVLVRATAAYSLIPERLAEMAEQLMESAE